MYAWLVEGTTIAAKAKDDFMFNGMHNFENTLSISTVSSVDRRVDRDGLLVAGSSAGPGITSSYSARGSLHLHCFRHVGVAGCRIDVIQLLGLFVACFALRAVAIFVGIFGGKDLDL